MIACCGLIYIAFCGFSKQHLQINVFALMTVPDFDSRSWKLLWLLFFVDFFLFFTQTTECCPCSFEGVYVRVIHRINTACASQVLILSGYMSVHTFPVLIQKKSVFVYIRIVCIGMKMPTTNGSALTLIIFYGVAIVGNRRQFRIPAVLECTTMCTSRHSTPHSLSRIRSRVVQCEEKVYAKERIHTHTSILYVYSQHFHIIIMVDTYDSITHSNLNVSE